MRETKMKLTSYFILIFVIVLSSCNSDKGKKTKLLNNDRISNGVTTNKESVIKLDSSDETENKTTDSTLTFRVDDYPVKNEMFKGNYGLKKSGKIISFDKVWFTHREINQTLVFELYTDYHRLIIYHFDNNIIPAMITNRMELHIEGGELATKQQKTKYFNGLVKQSIEVDENNFISEKGVYLGMPRKKAIEIYGTPDEQETESQFEILKWEFDGDAFNKNTNQKKPIARDSFGHSVTMIFRNDSLVGHILFNDIP